MVRSLLHLLILCMVHASFSRATGLQAKRHFSEIERDLKYAAHLSCAKSSQYTTVHPYLFYVDSPGPSSRFDYILSNFSASGTSNRVVHARISEEELEMHEHMTVTLTGTNSGLALGLTNGTSKVRLAELAPINIIHYIPMEHPRQNVSLCVQAGQLAEKGISSFYEAMKDHYKLSHVAILHNVILHAEGMAALECGWLQPRMGCANRILRRGRTWRRNITATIEKNTNRNEKSAWQSIAALSRAFDPSLPVHDEVFVINILWDFNFHHFIAESLPRMVRFYHYLQRHPHIKIQIRLEEMMGFNASVGQEVNRARQGQEMRSRVLQLLEISPERIVHGQMLARKVYLPNDIECASSLRHALDLRLLSRLFSEKAEKVVRSCVCMTPTEAKLQRTFTSHRAKVAVNGTAVKLPVEGTRVIVQARVCKGDWRCMNEAVAREVARAAEDIFPQSDVVVANTSLSRGMGCDIDLYGNADVVIGAHGAAMTNAMFMKPGTILVEIAGGYDFRIPPICGFYGPYAAVFGVHHYIYYYDGELKGARLDVPDLLRRVHEFYTAIRTNANYTKYDFPHSYSKK